MMNAIEGRVIFMCNNCGCRRRDCNRFWDDLMFGRCRRRDCDDCGCRRKRDCDCDDCRRNRKRDDDDDKCCKW